MRLLSLIIKLLLTGLLLLLLAPLLLLALMLEREPEVEQQPPLTSAEIEAVQQLLINNDPRRQLQAERQVIVLPEKDADVLLKYFFSQAPFLHRLRGRVSMEEDFARLALTLPLRDSGPYLNTRVGLNELSLPVQVSYIRVGNVKLPAHWITAILEHIARRFSEEPNYQLLRRVMDTIDSVELRQDEVIVHLRLNDEELSELSNQARDLLIAPAEQQRISEYYHLLVALENEQLASDATARRLSLHDLLQPLFVRAHSQTRTGSEAVAENRALFLALALYMSDLEPDQLMHLDLLVGLPSQRRLVPTIHRRLDLAQHLSISAALSVASTGSLAELVSTYKEVHDARYRAGFSFDDLLANQVGSALGHIAQNPDTAAELQSIMMTADSERDYMPDFRSEEGLSEADFEARYGDRQSSAYLERVQVISDAISARPVFSHFNTPVVLNLPLDQP